MFAWVNQLHCLIEEDKNVLSELHDLSIRLYRVEEDTKLIIAENRRLISENLRLQCQLKEVLKHDVSF